MQADDLIARRRRKTIAAKPAAPRSIEAQPAAAPPHAPPPAPPPDAGLSAMQAILRVEAEVRSAANAGELAHLLANEVRKLARARQVFVIGLASSLPAGATSAARPTVKAVSSVSMHERNAPLLQTLSARISKLARTDGLGATARFDVTTAAGDGTAEAYPLKSLVWVPLQTRAGRIIGGLVLARELAWSDADVLIAGRIAATGAHAWAALEPRLAARSRLSRPRLIAGICCAVLLIAMAIPVPMSALAPFEIVPRAPNVITAPLDAVVADVTVKPNANVRRGDVLVTFVDTTLRSRHDIAERELRVAEARLKRANQMAFGSAEGRRELAVASAERDVRAAEFAFAADMLSRAVVRADRAGIAVYNDRKDLVGRPIKTGERLMDVADPGQVQARLLMPLMDGALLARGAAVKLFLDSDPLNPVAASIVQADYQAKAHQDGQVSFRAFAVLDAAGGEAVPRLGLRGTAQVYGDPVPLGLYLFRRPLTAARQWLGL